MSRLLICCRCGRALVAGPVDIIASSLLRRLCPVCRRPQPSHGTSSPLPNDVVCLLGAGQRTAWHRLILGGKHLWSRR